MHGGFHHQRPDNEWAGVRSDNTARMRTQCFEMYTSSKIKIPRMFLKQAVNRNKEVSSDMHTKKSFKI